MSGAIFLFGFRTSFGIGPSCYGDEARDRGDALMRLARHFWMVCADDADEMVGRAES